MILTNKDIGELLKARMDLGLNAAQIGDWAFNLYQNYSSQMTDEAKEVICELRAMEAGPEFEYTSNELKYLVKLLLEDIKDPISLVNEFNPKFKWNTHVEINKNAPDRYKPGAIGLTKGLHYIETEQMAKKFNLPFDPNIDTQIYLVELNSGENIEIPKCYLTISG